MAVSALEFEREVVFHLIPIVPVVRDIFLLKDISGRRLLDTDEIVIMCWFELLKLLTVSLLVVSKDDPWAAAGLWAMDAVVQTTMVVRSKHRAGKGM